MCYFDITHYSEKELSQTQDPPVWPCTLFESIYRRVAQCILNSLSKVCVTRRKAQSKDDVLQCRMSPPCVNVKINPTGMTVPHRNALTFRHRASCI